MHCKFDSSFKSPKTKENNAIEEVACFERSIGVICLNISKKKHIPTVEKVSKHFPKCEWKFCLLLF